MSGGPRVKAPVETNRLGSSDNSMQIKEFHFHRGRWNYLYNEVFNSITFGSVSPVPISDAINNMRVLDAARKSQINQSEYVLKVPVSPIKSKLYPRRS